MSIEFDSMTQEINQLYVILLLLDCLMGDGRGLLMFFDVKDNPKERIVVDGSDPKCHTGPFSLLS